jgi:membrane complex biogenesis BtpA family protein
VKPAIGVIHLRPLPGSPGCDQTIDEIADCALRDAEALATGGMDGLLLENFGDAPFYPGAVPPWTIACLTEIAGQVRRRFSVPLGINVLRNDASAALSVAVAVSAQFIRVNILCGARVTDQGVIEGQAHRVLRERRQLGADDIQIWADVHVKHSGPLSPRALSEEVSDTIERGLADAVIISGAATGRPASLAELSVAQQAADRTPVLLGSGVTIDNLLEWLPLADGFIVGSALKQGGRADQPVDPEAVQAFVRVLRNRT